MIIRNILRQVFATFVLLTIFSVVFAFAANVSVPTMRLTDQRQTITANKLKPSACSAITVTVIIYCPATGGTCTGTGASELIIGSPNIDIIAGKGGSDCILGGGGNDDLTGNQASDVCIGGPGTDTFEKCETVIQ